MFVNIRFRRCDASLTTPSLPTFLPRVNSKRPKVFPCSFLVRRRWHIGIDSVCILFFRIFLPFSRFSIQHRVSVTQRARYPEEICYTSENTERRPSGSPSAADRETRRTRASLSSGKLVLHALVKA